MFLEPRPSRSRRASSRGFTLIELVTVVLIIGIIAVVATPTMATQLRERRSRQTAQEIAQLYASARMRAMGRGAAVMVRYDSVTGFQVVESIEGALAATRGAAACANLPGRGCLTTQWATPGESRVVKDLVPFNAGEIAVTMKAPSSGTTLTRSSVCFTPMGRTFASYDATLPVTPMAGAATIEVKRGATGIARTVAILPNGSARLAL